MKYIALLCIIMALQATAKGEPSLTPCQPIIKACNGIIEAQTKEINTLKSYNKQLADKVVEEEKPEILNRWTTLLLGVVIGGVVGYKLH